MVPSPHLTSDSVHFTATQEPLGTSFRTTHATEETKCLKPLTDHKTSVNSSGGKKCEVFQVQFLSPDIGKII